MLHTMNRTTIPPPVQGLAFWAKGYFIRVDAIDADWVYLRRWKLASGQRPTKGDMVSRLKLPLKKWPKKTKVLLEENA